MKFFFASVDHTQDTFDPSTHKREDIKVLRMEINHSENDFAHLYLEVSQDYNLPDNKYIWVSVEHDNNIHPLFFGILTNFPYSNNNNIMKLEYIAQFPGWEEQKSNLAQSLRVLPYWDDVFIPPGNENNYDKILESRPCAWHYDRINGAVTISSIAEGDRIIDLGQDIVEDSININIIGSALEKINIVGVVHWQQQINGNISLKKDILKAFGGQVQTLSPRLQKNWPKEGVVIGDSGFRINKSKCNEVRRITFPDGANAETSNYFAVKSNTKYRSNISDVHRMLLGSDTVHVTTPKYTYNIDFDAGFNYRQTRKEIIDIDIDVKLQNIKSNTEGGAVYIVKNSNDIERRQDTNQSMFSYFLTDRGKMSFLYLLETAKAIAVKSSRNIDISFETSFDKLIDVSCRDSIKIYSPRIPGGHALGKVSSYKLIACGKTGDLKSVVNIGVTTGDTNFNQHNDNCDIYSDELYADNGYFTSTSVIYHGDDKINYISYDNQIPYVPENIKRLINGDIVDTISVSNNIDDQEAFIQSNQYPNSNIDVLKNMPITKLEVGLISISAEPEIIHSIKVDTLPFHPPRGVSINE